MVDKLGITYSVGYGMIAEEISRITGAYYEKEKKYLHATDFLLRPEKTILVACYSTGANRTFRGKRCVEACKVLQNRGASLKRSRRSQRPRIHTERKFVEDHIVYLDYKIREAERIRIERNS